MSLLRKTISGLYEARKRASSPPTIEIVPKAGIEQLEGGSIICFAAQSEGDALNNLMREMVSPLASKASHVFIIDLNEAEWQLKLKDALENPVWFAYSFFAVGQEMFVNTNLGQNNIWEFYKIPFVRVYGDTPAYFPDKHLRKYKNSINLYGDPSFATFYHKWFKSPALSTTPTGFPLGMQELSSIDRHAKKSGMIIFPKNGNSPSSLISYWRSALPTSISRMLESISEACTSEKALDSVVSFDDMVLDYYKNDGIELKTNPSLLCFFVAQLDDYVRRVKSTIVTESILGLPVIVRGKNWGHVDFKGKKATLDQGSDYRTSNILMSQAPAIIDISPNIEHAPHDRVLRAIGSGTLFLTNKQIYTNSISIPPQRFTFNFNKQSIFELVEFFVLNPEEAIDLGISQATEYRKIYTVEAYAERVLEAVELMTLKLQPRPWGTQDFVNFPPTLFED